MQKRLRIFAGPNGSGKSTIIPLVVEKIEEKRLGVYVNADIIEKNLKETGQLNFDSFQLNISEKDVIKHFERSQFAPLSRAEPDLWKKIKVIENVFTFNGSIDSYLAADLAEFIRNSLFKSGISFTIETVMSHAGKLDLIRAAKRSDYKVYLYYIATEDPSINVSRVRLRVSKNGHPVSEDVIIKRYTKSLQNLKKAVMLCDRSYLFDNSGKFAEIVAEIEDGLKVSIIDTDNVPTWLAKYLLDPEA